MKRKNYLALALSLGLFSSSQLMAQNIQNNIYFQSGKHELTEEAKQELDKIIATAKQQGDFDLDILAYTDDMGTQKYNHELAARRAATVKAYFDAANIQATTTNVEGKGELALTDKGNAAEQRRENRRVEVMLTPFKPESLTDLYNYFFQRNEQSFTVRMGEDQTIRATKGTELFIPAESLQLVGGGEVAADEVVITMREAYSYQDMIFGNLTTSSHGDLIETGGMVHLEARTKDGRLLEIKPGKELLLSMPSRERLPSDMQLFYADRDATALATPINWEATGQPFVSTNFDSEPPAFNFSAIKMPNIPNIKEPGLTEWPQNAPKAPFKPNEPRQPTSRPTELPSKDVLIAENPQKKGESDKKYEERIGNLLTDAQKQVETNIRLNENSKKSYQAAIQKYQTAYAKYEKDLLVYNNYAAKALKTMDELKRERSRVLSWFDSFKWSDDFNTQLVTIIGASRRLDEFKKYLSYECRRLGLETEAAEVDAMSYDEQKTVKQVAIAFARCIRANFDFYGNHKIGEIKSKVGELIYSPDPDKIDLNQGNARLAYNMIESVYQHAKLLNMLIDNYNEVLNKSGFASEAQALDEICSRLLKIQEKVLQIKEERGLLTDKEAKTAYMNTTGIAQLGFINCDRFLNISEENCMMLTINEPQDKNLNIYATFETVNGVMSFIPQKEPNSYGLNKVPKDEKVRIIALRVVGGKVEAAVHHARAIDINQLKLTFKPYTLSELRYLMG